MKYSTRNCRDFNIARRLIEKKGGWYVAAEGGIPGHFKCERLPDDVVEFFGLKDITEHSIPAPSGTWRWTGCPAFHNAKKLTVGDLTAGDRFTLPFESGVKVRGRKEVGILPYAHAYCEDGLQPFFGDTIKLLSKEIAEKLPPLPREQLTRMHVSELPVGAVFFGCSTGAPCVVTEKGVAVYNARDGRTVALRPFFTGMVPPPWGKKPETTFGDLKIGEKFTTAKTIIQWTKRAYNFATCSEACLSISPEAQVTKVPLPPKAALTFGELDVGDRFVCEFGKRVWVKVNRFSAKTTCECDPYIGYFSDSTEVEKLPNNGKVPFRTLKRGDYFATKSGKSLAIKVGAQRATIVATKRKDKGRVGVIFEQALGSMVTPGKITLEGF